VNFSSYLKIPITPSERWLWETEFNSLFQSLSQWGRSKKRARDDRDVIKKKLGEGVTIHIASLNFLEQCHPNHKTKENRKQARVEKNLKQTGVRLTASKPQTLTQFHSL